MIKRRIQIDVFNMERYLSFVCLFFFFVGNVDRIQCFARVAISANLKRNTLYKTTGWQKLTEWITPSGSGHMMSAASLNSGDFQAASSGLYNIFTTITFSGAENGLFKVGVFINNDEQNTHPGLFSTFKNSAGFKSASVFSSARLQSGNTLSVYVYSENDTDWTLIGSSESTFGIEFVGFFSYVPGFSGYLMRPHTTDGKEWSQILRWRSYGIPGLFRSRTGFSEDIGSFVSICDGVYLISANLRFSITQAGSFELGIALNEDTTGSIISHDEAEGSTTFSLPLALSLKLKGGDEVTLVVKGTTSFTIESDSSFAGILINEGGTVPGFSTVFFAPVNGTGQTWVNIPIPVPTPTFGQFETIPGSISSGKYYHADLQIFTISAIIKIQASSSTAVFITLHSDGSALNTVRTGVFSTKDSSSSVVSYSLTGILELPADTPLRLFIKLDNQESYLVMPGSRISVASSQQDYQAFHIAAASPISLSVKDNWVKVENMGVHGSGSYSLTGKLENDGRYTAGITGVYFVSANIIFQDPNGPISIIISLNGDTSKRRSLYATKGNPASVRDSLSVSGTLHVRKGETISVHAMVDNDASWSVSKESSFSVVFIGQHFAISGFSTVLTNKIPVTETNWVKMTNWLPQGVSGAMFSSGGGFDYAKGNYVAPHSGLYLVSVNLKVQDGSSKDSKFQMTVALDSNPGSYENQNGLQDYIEHKYSPSSNDFYSLVVSGVLKVNKGQNISVWMKSTGDSSYGVSQDSSFSVVFLSALDSIYASAASLMLDPSISQIKRLATGWKKVLYWRKWRQDTAPSIFQIGNLLTLDSNSGNMYIEESGIYFVSASISIKAEYNSEDDILGDFELAIHTKTGPAALITKYMKTSRTVFTMKVFGTLYLSTQTVISVKVHSTTPNANWENLTPHCSFSIARIPPFPVPPSVISGLPLSKRLLTKQGFWSRVTDWNVNKASTQELSGGGFNGKNGIFTAQYTGIYFISTSLTISSNVTDFFVRIKLGLNGDTSSPGSMVVDTSNGATHMIANCYQECARPISLIISLNSGDNLAVYVQTNAPYLDLSHSTSFTVKYLLPLHPLPDGFSMQVKTKELVIVYGDKQVKGWNLKANSGNYIKETGDSKDEYSITTTGLYFVSVNIEFDDVKGMARVMPSIDSIPALSSTYYSTQEESFTISVSGVMKINAGSVYTVLIFTESDQYYRISDLSTSSMTYIGPPGHTPGFTATRNLPDVIDLPAMEWTRITSWSTSGKDYLFRYGTGFESKTSYIVQESGFYFCSINLAFKSSGNITSILELALVHNNINNFDNGLYSTSVIHPGGTATLQVTGGIALGVWDFLEVQVRSSETMDGITLNQDSTFSIVKFGEDLSAVGCADLGPNIVGQLIPDNIRLSRGSSISWDCFATGTAPTYQWSKDFQDINLATGTRLELNDLEVADTGKYVCSATAGGVTASSNIATVTVFEPLPVFLNPVEEYTVRTAENGDPNLVLLDIKAKAESAATSLEEMNFEIVAGDVKNQFSISPLSGSMGTVLSRVKSLDREDIERYVLKISAVNVLKPNEPVIQNITVIVTDLNDNFPEFEHPVYKVTVLEDIAVGTNIITVTAIDKDIGENADIRYSIIPGTAKTVFSISAATGDIVLMESLDREQRDEYVLLVKSFDGKHENFTEVYITIADVNEHKPYFIKSEYTVTVSESIASSIPIVHLLAEDKDTGDNALIVYDIVSGDPAQQFTISEKGELSVLTHLDYETNSSHHLVITLRDSGNPPLHSDGNATVWITVRNTNDNRPQFSLPEYLVYIKENSLKFENDPFHVYAEDPDGGIGRITYRIQEDGNITEIFEISYLTGLVQINNAPDFEVRKFYQFTVEASDNDGIVPKVSAAKVVVVVKDVNDNRPYFTETRGEVSIIESSASNRIVYTVSANDIDSVENGYVNYKIVEGNINDQFYINPYTGAVTTQRATDREEISSYILNITAFDSGTPPLESSNSFLLQVNIDDANDNPPKFAEKSYTASVREDTPIGTSILTLTVRDSDLGKNGMFDLSILEPSFRDRFSLVYKEPNVYELVLSIELNFEERTVYQFTMSAKDHGDPPLESSVPITINVEDVNDNRPVFGKSEYSTTLIDNPATNLTVFQVIATDQDIGPKGRLSYHIVGGNIGDAFSITESTGIIRTKAPQNSTFLPSYRLNIIARDGYDPPLSSDVIELFIRVSHIPTIHLKNTDIGQFQIRTTIQLGEFSHLTDVIRMEVLVQQYHSDEVLLNTYSTEPATSWYTVFVSKSHPHNKFRRWVAIEDYFPLDKNRNRRSVSSIQKDDEIEVIVGNNITCTEQIGDIHLVCNGPLGAGSSYRIQARIYEQGSLMPIESHFSQALHIPAILPAKATLQETVADGMLALGATFALVYVTMLLVFFIYVCWKRTHEIVHVDHLKENRGQFPLSEDDRFSALQPTTSYFSPRTGKLHKFGNSDGNGLWPGMSMTEHNQMAHRRDGMFEQDNQMRGVILRGFHGGYDNHHYESDDMMYGKAWKGYGNNIIDDDMDSLYAPPADIRTNEMPIDRKKDDRGLSQENDSGNKNVRFEKKTLIIDESPRDNQSIDSNMPISI